LNSSKEDSQMPKHHGAKQQKRLAKQKAKRAEKRAFELRRNSGDPTIRLEHAGKWPVVQSVMGSKLWKDGLAYMMIARQESDGRYVFAAFVVDVFCLGVKNAFWRAGTRTDLDELIDNLEQAGELESVTPEYLAKVVTGAVEYAQSLGFQPHADYRHAALLLQGIDPATCSIPCTFGKDGKPVYIAGPNESFAQAMAISARIGQVGEDYLMGLPGADFDDLHKLEGEFEGTGSPGGDIALEGDSAPSLTETATEDQ
jgi:hypothetical protein